MQVANNQTQQYLYQNQTAKSENKNSENFKSLLNQQENSQTDQTLKADKVELNYSSKNNSSTGVYPTNLTNSKPLEKTTETVSLTNALQKTEKKDSPLLTQLLKGADPELEKAIRFIEPGPAETNLFVLMITVGEKISHNQGITGIKSIQDNISKLNQNNKINFSTLGNKEDIKSFLAERSALHKVFNAEGFNVFEAILQRYN